MTNRLLFIKLTDLLLFALLVKSQAGIDVIEEKPNIAYTSPREYLWIFILNQKLGLKLDAEKQNTLAKSIFWIFQIIFNLKRYYKETDNRRKRLTFTDMVFHKVMWFRTVIEMGDKPGIKNMKLYSFYNKFCKEINRCSLTLEEKKYIFRLFNKTIRKIYVTTSAFMNKDFDKLKPADVFYWYQITYQQFSDFFVPIYMLLAGIKPAEKRWQETLDFGRKLVLIGAIHDDVSDIKTDIDNNGRLREPNLFACFLTPYQKRQIGMVNQGKYIPNNMEQAKKEFPQAYRKINMFIKDTLRNISLIPGINLHELLEFYVYHFPDYLPTHLAIDSVVKKTFKIDSLRTIAMEKNNFYITQKFRQFVTEDMKLDRYKLNRMYFDLISYLYSRELYQSGWSLTDISNITKRPISTISRWIEEKQLPITLRYLQNTGKGKEYANIYYLLGVFAFAGSVNHDHIRISNKDSGFLKKLNRMLSPDKTLIYKTGNNKYLRFYDRQLVLKLGNMIKNLVNTLQTVTNSEKEEFVEGLIEAKGKSENNRKIFHFNKEVNPRIIAWIKNYFQSNNYSVAIKKSGIGRQMTIVPGDNQQEESKNIPVEMQNIKEFQSFAKLVILKYFGLQSTEFWAEFPGLFYICLAQSEAKFKYNNLEDLRFKQFFKYQILSFFRKYFSDKSKTAVLESSTYLTDQISDDGKEKETFEDIAGFEKDKVKKALKKLEKTDYRSYAVAALRFGLFDGRVHSLTGDLSKRLFDLGIKGQNSKVLTKSQTYQLLQSSLSSLRKSLK